MTKTNRDSILDRINGHETEVEKSREAGDFKSLAFHENEIKNLEKQLEWLESHELKKS